MNNNNRTTQAGWERNERLVRRWREQRTDLVRRLEAHHDPAHSDSDCRFLDRQITMLCQSLIDYLSIGHFTIFVRLLGKGEGYADPDPGTARRLLRSIEASTDHALDFNDKYDTDAASLAGEPSLPEDLASLERILHLRFELEEQLVAMFHNSHRDRVA